MIKAFISKSIHDINHRDVLTILLMVKAAIEVKFVVAITSISAIIFFSALIPCILATDIKIPIWKLVVIWFYSCRLHY